MALYVPPFRVDLSAWCDWRAEDQHKIREVVGTGFRLPGPQQSVYTMAATAVLHLIEKYEVDPQTVRFLALGTESSTDNSAGAVIARGMVDQALLSQGRLPLARNCEVPEFKHACLGGIYALKNAIRFLQTDGQDTRAIVVCSDIALYAPDSSGEPTQGAGAVAFLLENDPKIASIDLRQAGSASDYRGVDFRKPIQYLNGDGHAHACSNIPVFNGRYSASCYVDEMLFALEDMYIRRGLNARDYLRNLAAVFMHRPFRRMPENAWGMAYLFSLANGDAEALLELAGYSAAAGAPPEAVRAEMTRRPDLLQFGVRDRIGDEVLPLATQVLRKFRQLPIFKDRVLNRMRLGTARMEELGNLYTGSLPAWLAAGLEQARSEGAQLAGRELLLFGYGSGDAAEAIPVTVMPGWEEAVGRIDIASAMAGAIDLNQEQYAAMRQGLYPALEFKPRDEFIVERIGTASDASFQDKGIEYYRYIS